MPTSPGTKGLKTVREPHIDHQTIALAFANALSFLLLEQEGIIVQGEDADHKMHKFLVYRYEDKIRVQLGNEIDKEVGTKFMLHDHEQDAILAAALSGSEFIID